MRPNKGYYLILIAALAALALGPRVSASPAPVYVIDLHGPVWPVQADFVTRCIDDASRNGASAVILDVDTNGGMLDSADEVQKAIYEHDTDFPIVAFVHNKAFSSGALITLSCKYIAMTGGATLGSALPHPGMTGSPDAELLQAIQNRFKSIADMRGRNPAVAVAMVTAPSAIPSLGIKAGDILSLTTRQARDAGYCDVVANDYPDILAFLKLSGAPVQHEELGAWLEIALFIINPWVTVLLLGGGLALIAMELLTFHTHGLLALVGGALLALVFVAHIAVGVATVAGAMLFLLGVALFLVETHVFPGHGLAAFAGLVLVFVGMFMALGGSHANAMLSLSGAILVTCGALVAFFMYLPRSRVWQKIGQNSQQRATEGYVSSADYTGFVGKSGIAVTMLRPSGIAEVAGARLNVVTTGEYVKPGAPVEVTMVAGNRIVVHELPPPV
ncbi:MAG: NfeD family protein [Capsulimonadaceae bacterium]|nr:NfeD family protein [Capsulimonadaceae bacterium]